MNNAGGARPGALGELSRRSMARNLRAQLFLGGAARAAGAPQMEARGGVIINISSIYGRESGGPLTYNSSKAAMISFTKMLAREMAAKNVRINSIAPGSIQYPGGSWERRFKENPAFEKDFIATRCRPAGSGARKKSPTRW